MLWQAIDKVVEDLVNNTDIEEKTERDYIVGYICKSLFDADIIN